MAALSVREHRVPMVLQRPSSSERRYALRIGMLLALPTILLVVTAIARYVNGRAGIDLIIFDQALWKGSEFRDPISTAVGESLLEDHFSPAMFLFVPLYQLAATPVWLLLAQGVAAWVAVLQICLRAQPSIGPRKTATIGVLLLLSPPVAYALLWDVHSVVFALPFALAAVFAVHDEQEWRALGLGLAAALFRADVAYAVMAAFVCFPGGFRRRLVPGALLLAYLGFASLMEHRLGHPDTQWQAYLGYLGESPLEALAHPHRVVAGLVTSGFVVKVLPWLAACGFLCLRRPRLMIPAFAAATVTILARWPGTYSWLFHYGIAPTLLLSLAWISVVQRRPELGRFVIGGLAALFALGGPLSPVLAFVELPRPMLTAWKKNSDAVCAIEGIPRDAGISTATGVGNLLTHRELLYAWPYPFEGLDEKSLPSPHLHQPAPHLAVAVDYIIREAGEGKVPAGFLLEATTGRYERYRRAATTTALSPNCAAPAGPVALSQEVGSGTTDSGRSNR